MQIVLKKNFLSSSSVLLTYPVIPSFYKTEITLTDYHDIKQTTQNHIF